VYACVHVRDVAFWHILFTVLEGMQDVNKINDFMFLSCFSLTACVSFIIQGEEKRPDFNHSLYKTRFYLNYNDEGRKFFINLNRGFLRC
jgi:hypothetical protein